MKESFLTFGEGIDESTHFIKTFVVDLDAALTKLKPNARLTLYKDFGWVFV